MEQLHPVKLKASDLKHLGSFSEVYDMQSDIAKS